MKRFLPLLLLLSACNGTLAGNQLPKPTPSQPAAVKPAATDTLFGNALNKRTLSLNLFGQGAAQGNTAQGSRNATDSAASGPQKGVAAPTAPAAEASGGGTPGAAPMPGMASRAGLVADKMIAPWFGGEFNQYVLQYAEENDFAASKATTLLGAYSQTVKPLLGQWDADARLIESQAHFGSGKGNDEGLFYLPDERGNPIQLKVNYLFRFASSSRKETLVFYLTDTETRVHRLVWGEPDVDLSRVKLDSNQAQATALKALTSRTSKPDYPVYPEQSSPEMEIIYEIPAGAHWQISLNQNTGVSRYFASVNFEREDSNQPEGKQMVYGSVEIDAESGKIYSLNRPVLYHYGKEIYPQPPIYIDPPKPVDPTEPAPQPEPKPELQ